MRACHSTGCRMSARRATARSFQGRVNLSLRPAYQTIEMTFARPFPGLVFALLALLAGCATRPINLPITHTDPGNGYRFEVRQEHARDKENLVVLAFSGGGTRAAAFSYGVLEFLRRAEVIGPRGNKVRLLDEVDVITGVSGRQLYGTGIRPLR